VRWKIETALDGILVSLSEKREAAPPLTDPPINLVRHGEIAAVYTGQRVSGDFYEFLRVGGRACCLCRFTLSAWARTRA